MDEIVVKKGTFDKALAKLEQSSKENEKITELTKFKEKDGPFYLFPKTVTGKEMNDFTSQLQGNLIVLNDKINKFYVQFVDVYSALESLDKEYISGIVGAFNEAIEARKRADDAQEDVNKTVEQLMITVEKLKEFDENTTQKFNQLDSFKKQCDELQNELVEYKKEKKKTATSITVLSISTIVLAVSLLVLVLLNILNII